MCCTFQPAKLSNTILYAGEAPHPHVRGRLVHVNGYQNTVQTLYRAAAPVTRNRDFNWPNKAKPVRRVSEGNAMILPVPAADMMGPLNMIDTSSCRNVLEDMRKAVQPQTRSRGSLSFGMNVAKSVQVFEHDIYTVVLGKDMRECAAAISEQVAAEKQPKINPEIFEAYAKWYPDWSFMICCFNNADAQRAAPLLWWYEPMHSELLFAPALDAHTGSVPVPGEEVEVDHAVAFATHDMRDGNLVSYSETRSDEIQALLPRVVVGAVHSDLLPNADFVCETEAVRAGRYDMRRLTPPGF